MMKVAVYLEPDDWRSVVAKLRAGMQRVDTKEIFPITGVEYFERIACKIEARLGTPKA